MRPSLGRRLVVGMVATTALAVALAALTAWLASRSLLHSAVDDALRERQESLVRRGVLLPRNGWPGPPDAPGRRGPMLMEVAELDGATLLRTPGLDGAQGLPASGEQIAPYLLSDGRAVRGLTFTANVRERWGPPETREQPPTGRHVRVALAIDVSDLHAELRRLAWVLAGVSLIAVLAAAFLALALRRAVLRPVAVLADAVLAISPDDLSARLPGAGAPAELALVVERLNGLLERLDAAMLREKQTLAAVAHELRTPVAGLRSTLEFALRRDDGARARETYVASLDVVVGMQAMVANLLVLARIESGQAALDRGPCDFAAAIAAGRADIDARLVARGIALTCTVPETAQVALDPTLVRLIAGNLLDNLASHADAGAATLILEPVERTWRLTLDNAAATLADPQAALRPFWRGDAARQVGTHCGLGLALCQRIATAAGGTIEVASADGRFRIAVSLPAS